MQTERWSKQKKNVNDKQQKKEITKDGKKARAFSFFRLAMALKRTASSQQTEFHENCVNSKRRVERDNHTSDMNNISVKQCYSHYPGQGRGGNGLRGRVRGGKPQNCHQTKCDETVWNDNTFRARAKHRSNVTMKPKPYSWFLFGTLNFYMPKKKFSNKFKISNKFYFLSVDFFFMRSKKTFHPFIGDKTWGIARSSQVRV